MVATDAPVVSHGRGGMGNINADDTEYVDGSITRQGQVGSHGDGPFSAGRGGAANIGDTDADATKRTDKIVVPAVNVRPSMEDENYHTGRGGVGNAHVVNKDASAHMGLADKLKKMVMGLFGGKK